MEPAKQTVIIDPDTTNPSGYSNYSQQNSVKLDVPLGAKQMWLKLTIDIDTVTEFKFPPGVTNVEFGYISAAEGDPACNHFDHDEMVEVTNAVSEVDRLRLKNQELQQELAKANDLIDVLRDTICDMNTQPLSDDE